ncbi:MAG TPA: TadE/TadG family type IV pilus assembly protein [Chloroflexota bacterium]|nr:TadE/TadG family type IV pilus assembly protein [Chloroflexota bacterium]
MHRLIVRARKEEQGAIAVMAVILMVVFIAILGSAIDLGMFFVTRANLQNAVDAAALAGSRALVSGANPGQTAAKAAANSYLALYGIVDGQNGATVQTPVYSQDPITGATNRMTVSVTRQYTTYFLKLIGLNTMPMSNAATAEASPGMADIGLSLDLTGSMELSGTNDLQNLQNAVVEFINDVNPDTSNPTGPQIAMARWAGVMCRWNGFYSAGPPPVKDTSINLSPGTSEYVSPCADDKTVVSNLTMDKAALLNLANNVTKPSCTSPYGTMSCNGALTSWTYTATDKNGHDGAAQSITINGQTMALTPTYTGTKEPNAISVFSNGSYYAWSTANGGRNVGNVNGNAHKVLVIITDGNDELWPTVGMPTDTQSDGCVVATAVPDTISYNDTTTPWGCWDQEAINYANTLKKGPDGVSGTADDVEIYTIGFYCTPYNSNFYASSHQNWCTSKMAQASPHPCPGAWNIAAASRADYFLWSMSSSSPGTCDHYFPISKTEQLPQYFKQIAGAIARGKLVG